MKIIPFKNFPNVSDDKITLRQIRESEIIDLIEISYYDAVQATSLQQAIEMNAKINEDFTAGNSIHWAIIDNHSHKIVGTCGYYRGLEKRQGELGCVLLPAYRGQGFMTAAMLLAIHYGIYTLGLNRIFAVTDHQNQKAINLLERLHFSKIRNLSDKEAEYEWKQS